MDTFDFDYSYEVEGDLYGRTYHVGVRASPSLNQVEDFAALIFWVKSDGKLVEIARIDNTEHPDDEEDGPHIHRWYRGQDMHDRDYDIPVENWHEADGYLLDNFSDYAKRYEDNHGDEIVAYDH